MTVVVPISHSRGMLIVIFRRINCNEEQQVINCWFFNCFSTDIFISTPKTKYLNFSIDSPVQCCPKKANLYKTFAHGIYWKDLLSGAPLCTPPGNLNLKTPGLIFKL